MNFQFLGFFTSASAISCERYYAVCRFVLEKKYFRVDVVFYGSLILAISGISATKILETSASN